MAADHTICFITLGESGVGKTSLLIRFSKNYFVANPKYTLGVEKYYKTITLNNKNIRIELWDTAGQERNNGLFKKYFRDADGVLLVYDMANHATYMKITSWLHDLRKLNKEATAFIVGNKADLRHLNPVSGTTVENFVRDEELNFYETSAKKNENVNEVFEKLALKVLERKKITPFYKEISNGEIEAAGPSNTNSDVEIEAAGSSNTNSDGEIEARRSRKTVSTSSQTEDIPTITLSDGSGATPKQKKKGCCK